MVPEARRTFTCDTTTRGIESQRMRNVFTIARKDLLLLWRDKFGLFWVVAFPLIMALFFGTVFGGQSGEPAGMDVAIVDLDQSEISRQFAQRLDETDSLNVWQPSEERPEPLTIERAADMVATGDLAAYIIIPRGYGDSGYMFDADAEALQVGIDPSRKAEAGYLQGMITEAAFKRMQDQFSDPEALSEQITEVRADIDNWEDVSFAQRTIFKTFFASLDLFLDQVDPEIYAQGPGGGGGDDGAEGAGFNPVRIETKNVSRVGEGPTSAFEISFPQAMAWALIGTCAGFAITLVRERKEGTLLRLRVAPQSQGHILAGKALACFVSCAGAVLMLTAVGALILDVRIVSPGLYALAVVCSALCFVGVMMAISVIGKTEEAVAGAGWGVLLIMSMLGGGMVPLFVMPGWMADLALVSPVRWAVYALEGAIWRGLTAQEMLLPMVVLVGVGTIAFTIGVVVLKRTDG